MDHELEAVRNGILARGTDDWVHIAEVAYEARRAWYGERLLADCPADGSADVRELARRRDDWLSAQEREALPLGIRAVKSLLRDGLVRVGQARETFVPWEGTAAEVESRIDAAVETATFPLLPGQLFWVDNTAAGDAKAEADLGLT